MKKNKIIALGGCLIATVGIGCSSPIPELTEEETIVISEYAASLLLSYDKNYNNKLKVEEVEEEIVVPELEEEIEVPKLEELPQPEVEVEKPEVQVEEVIKTFQEVLELDGMEFEIQGIRIATSCSESEIEEGTLSFTAFPGNELVILQVAGRNITEEIIELNMISINPSITMHYQTTRKNVQPTMLINDFTTFVGSVEPNSTKDFLVIAEFTKDLVEDSELVKVYINKSGESYRVK